LWKKLFVDHPVRQTFFIAGNNLWPLRAKCRIEILVAESDLVFFDVTVGINDAHGGILRWIQFLWFL
jgi:hypothetical protein